MGSSNYVNKIWLDSAYQRFQYIPYLLKSTKFNSRPFDLNMDQLETRPNIKNVKVRLYLEYQRTPKYNFILCTLDLNFDQYENSSKI